MAPLEPSNTKRWFLDYSVDGADHTLIMRSTNAVNETAANLALDDFLDQITVFTHAVDIRGLRVANQGSDVTNPATWTGLSTYGSGDAQTIQRPSFISFHGRDASGRRVNATMYGFDGGYTDNYRLTPAESESVQDVLDFLEAQTLVFITIAGAVAAWKQYANVGLNAYWLRHNRRSA